MRGALLLAIPALVASLALSGCAYLGGSVPQPGVNTPMLAASSIVALRAVSDRNSQLGDCIGS
jgi:hypothetical protein